MTKRADILFRETLFQGYFRVDRLHLQQELFAGGTSPPYTREVFTGGGKAAVVLLYDPRADKVVMIEQVRAGPLARGEDPLMIELVAGHVDSGESPEDTARRESLEEAGCVVEELQKIVAYYPSPGCMSEHVTAFIGRVTAPQDGEIHGLAHEGEDIRLRVEDAAQAINNIYMGLYRDAATLIVMQWFSLNRTSLRSRWLSRDSSTPII